MAGRVASASVAVELGYAIEADAGPSGSLDHWRIAGVPGTVTEVFSKRSAEIDAAMAAEGFTSPRARGVAARRTRAAKTGEAPEALMVRWLDELDDAGWPARKVDQRLRIINQRVEPPAPRLTDLERTALVRRLLGPDGPLTERKAFTRAEVTRFAAPALYGREPDELDRTVDAVLHHPEAIPLIGQPGARGRAWATASALATEAAVESVAQRLTDHNGAAAIAPSTVNAAIRQKEARLGRRLTRAQLSAIIGTATSGRGLDLVVGIAGSGKTTALDVLRSAYQAEGCRVLGTAISGQAARALHDEAGVEARTIASLVWRLEHDALRLDDRTVLLIDEAGMADDPAMLKLLTAADVASAKVIVIGDHRQLGAVGPGGGLEALINRHSTAVHVLDENVRQQNLGERVALEHLRSGNVTQAVDWYRQHDRLRTAPTRPEAIEAAVAAWDQDQREGVESVLLAWRRADVAALNQAARQRRVKSGDISGAEVKAPGGRRYATGDRVVTLAPSGDGRYVTSERATVTRVTGEELQVRFDDGRHNVLSRDELSKDRLDYAYALTVHRMQGATVDRAHVLADGGGRELAYVAMSRARDTIHIHVVTDDLDQAADDLAVEWTRERRQRWVIDTEALALGTARRPYLHRRAEHGARRAALIAERDAITAVASEPCARIAVLDTQLRLTATEHRSSPGVERRSSL
jgi:hypothetical protein